LRGSLDARSEALSQLSDLATVLLRDAGHNPTPETIHRITTTLEALSAHATLSDGPTAGRLTQDVDPPGFASLASLIPGISATDTTKRVEEPARITPSQKSGSAAAKPRQANPTTNAQKIPEAEETHRARVAAAKVSLQEARRSLTEAQRRAQRSEAAQKKALAEAKKADADVRQAEKHLRDAEQRFKKASAVSEMANRRARSLADEVEDATKAVADAKSSVEKALKDLETLFRQSPGK